MITTLNINPNFQVDYYTTDPNLRVDGKELCMRRLERLLMGGFLDVQRRGIIETTGRLNIYESRLSDISFIYYPDTGLLFRVFLETLTPVEEFSSYLNPNSKNMQTIFESGKPYNSANLKLHVERLQNAKFLCATIPPHNHISCLHRVKGEIIRHNKSDSENLFAWCGLTKDISEILYSRKVN